MITIPGPIPVRIHPFFWVLVLFISIMNNLTDGGLDWVAACICAVVIVVSVTVHEYGHALTAIAFGQRANIELVGFGGVTKRQGPKLNLWKDFIVVLNGPVAGFSLCLLAWMFWNFFLGKEAPATLRYTVFITYWANLFWTVVNLLPIQPMDGGHLLRIFLEGLMGLRGVKISLFISFLCSILISLGFLVEGFFLVGAFFLIFTYESLRDWRNSLVLTDKDRDLNLQNLLKLAERDLRKGHMEMAVSKLNSIREAAKGGVIYITATQLLSEALSHQGNFTEAYKILWPLRDKLSDDSLHLLQQLAFRCGEWEQAITVGNTAYQSHPTYETALINAFCYGLLGEARPAIGWLQCAERDGVPDLQQILSKSEFDKIRTDPLFQKLQEQA